jgi:hypothetical protein
MNLQQNLAAVSTGRAAARTRSECQRQDMVDGHYSGSRSRRGYACNANWLEVQVMPAGVHIGAVPGKAVP